MKRIYYVYRKLNGEYAISAIRPKDGKVVGMAGSLDGAKQLMLTKVSSAKEVQRSGKWRC
jgi:hypothetical protein